METAVSHMEAAVDIANAYEQERKNGFMAKINNRIWTMLKHRILPSCFLPVILIATLVHLCSYSSNALLEIPLAAGRQIWYFTVCLLSVYPLLCSLNILLKKIKKKNDISQNNCGRHYQNVLLIIGIFSSHVVTVIALYQKQIIWHRMILLLIYDLILIGSWYYWRYEREGFERGLQILAFILWVSALYGIAEHYFPMIPFLYRDSTGGLRVISVFANTIPASSMWLMGMWLPFPGTKKNWWLNAAVKVCFILAIFFTGSKNAWVGLVLSMCFFAVLNFGEVKKSIPVRHLKKVAVAASLFSIAGIILVIKFSEYLPAVLERWKDVQTQNTFLARIQHIQDTLQYMGTSPLLRKILGYGYATSWQFVEDSPHYYGLAVRCIDNQYFTSLFEFGFISIVCIVIWGCRLFSHLKSADRFVRGAAFGLLAMLIPLWSYDPFRWGIVMILFLPLSQIMLMGEPVSVPWEKVCSGVITAGIAIVGGVFLIPKGLRCFRTISQNYASYIGIPPRQFEILLWLLMFGVSVWVFLSLYLWLLGRNRRKQGICFFAGLAVGVLVGGICFALLERQADKYKTVLDSEEEALRQIVASSGGKVVVDENPSLYQRRFGGVSGELFTGDKIIRADKTTLVVDRDFESVPLLEIGFLFTEISDEHAVYTDDPGVEEALTGCGYHLTGYYSAEKKVLLYETEKEGKQMFSSGQIAVRPGKYTVLLKTDEVDPEAEEGREIELRIFRATTQELLLSQKGSSFEVTIKESPYAVNGMEQIRLETDVTDGQKIAEYHLLLKQTPDLDVHEIFDYSDHKIREEYYSLSGEKTVGMEGTFAIEYSFNRRLQLEELRYLDAEDQLTLNTSGYAKSIYRNKAIGPVRISYYGTDDKPVILTSGYASEKRTYDKAGNITENQYLNKKGKLTLNNSGYAVVHKIYDEHNNVVFEEYKGKNDELIMLSGRYACIERAYDNAGRVLSVRYLGTDRQAVMTANGYSELRYEYNEKGQIIGETYYDEYGNITTLPGGYARLRYERDESGNAKVLNYCNEMGDLVIINRGFATSKRVFDTHNRIIREDFFDKEGKPVEQVNGYATEKIEYNENGTVKARKYYGVDGEPILLTSGCAQVRYEYNVQKMVIRETYYDREGKQTCLPSGYSSVGYTRDARGNAVETRYYDLKDELVVTKNGYACVRRKYNKNNWLVREEYFNEKYDPVAVSSGQAAEKRKYDGNGNNIERRFYGIDGSLTVLNSGCSRIQYEYNHEKMIVKESYCDPDGNPVMVTGGYSFVTYERDNKGNVICYKYYDLEGRLVMNASGYAILNRYYDRQNRIICEEYKNEDGELTALASGQAIEKREYDEIGNIIRRMYYGPGNIPICVDGGYASVYYEYNKKGQITGEYYYDEKDEPVMTEAGYASVLRRYDKDGSLAREECFDEQGELLKK